MIEPLSKEKCTCLSSSEVAVCLKDCDIRFDDPPLPARRTSKPMDLDEIRLRVKFGGITREELLAEIERLVRERIASYTSEGRSNVR